MNYEHDQERLLSTASHTVSAVVSAGAQLWASQHKTLKVQIRTAAQDVQDAQKALQQGTPKLEILKSILQGEVSKRVADTGGDNQKYAGLIFQKAETNQAVGMMPTQTPAHAKTPKKAL